MWQSLAVLLLFLSTRVCFSDDPLTQIVSKKDMPTNKFTRRTAAELEDVVFKTDATPFQKKSACPLNLDLVWSHSMESGIYATPIIQKLYSDGPKHIVVPSFHRDLNLLDHDGHKMPGWPFTAPEGVSFHTSPLLMDYNGDGYLDFIWVSADAEIYIISGDRNSGPLLLDDPFVLPKLRVKKSWYEGLSQVPCTNNDAIVNKASNKVPSTQPSPHSSSASPSQSLTNSSSLLSSHSQPLADQPTRRKLLASLSGELIAERSQVGDGLTEEGRTSLDLFSSSDPHMADTTTTTIHHYSDTTTNNNNTEASAYVYVDAHVLVTPVLADIDNDGFSELVLAVSYFFDEEDYNNHPHLYAHLGADVNRKNYVAGGLVVFSLREGRVLWSEHLDLTTENAEMTAYIYCPPSVVDLDGDGELEIVLGTSLGFIYVVHAQNGELQPGFPLAMGEIQAQVAIEDVNADGYLEMIALDNKGNVLCFDHKGKEIWETQISGFSAQGATFGDVNGDGEIDVAIATVTGHVWVLHGKNGTVLPHFPLKTDGRIIAPITLSHFSPSLPHRLISSLRAASSSSVLPTTSFSPSKSLSLIFPSFDGHVYIVDGGTGCTNKIDLGEESYSMVLVDDILDNGRMQLLVSTMSGNIFCFATNIPSHPLKSWRFQFPSINGNAFSSKFNYLGVYVVGLEHNHLDVTGSSMLVTFEIVDHRAKKTLALAAQTHSSSSFSKPTTGTEGHDAADTYTNLQISSHSQYRDPVYLVNLTTGNVRWWSGVFTTAGQHTIEVESPSRPMQVVFQLIMLNEHSQAFVDSFSASFNIYYYRILKFVVVVPFIVMSFFLYFLKRTGMAR
eukprot:TRINITY_DN3294_c0_g1_i1.p1 TRINITY_DN3294_c0_g1~~TRINITY_DN3294_c0_g1_i1.p1  ORF type:complete len:840 (-),score=130.77 TRINITY_DN3294_c0_g1_i1:99-2618(-)